MTHAAPTATEKLHLKSLAAARGPRRIARRGTVHFVPDVTSQVSFVSGTPVDAVPRSHIAWKVKQAVAAFDLSALRSKASPLGRHGFDPAFPLAVWLLASLDRVHSASEIARRLQTDQAYRLVAGGHELSASLLRTFRRQNLLLMVACNEQLLQIAYDRGHVDLEQTALDSVRIEADAASASIRMLERSQKLVKQLAPQDTSAMTPEQAERHQKRLAKHQHAVAHCGEMGVTNFSGTDPLAAMMKFPHGGSKPGHRLTTVVAGAAIRFCIAFYLSSKPSDHGLLGPTLEALRARLRRIGVPDDVVVKTAADAGFCNEDDVLVATENSLNIDVVLAQQSFTGLGDVGVKGLFGKNRFVMDGNIVTCPAGTRMQGPHRDGDSILKWFGVGCATCPLRAQCTTAERRTLKQNPKTVAARATLRARMNEPQSRALYDKRGPIVESMYSVLEDAMGFRRVNSRHPATVQTELIMKILAYNLTRLWAAETKKGKPVDDNDGLPHFFWTLPCDDWPVDLIDAVLDFVLELQATNPSSIIQCDP